MKKTDYAIAILVGFFTGIFAVPTALNLGVRSVPILLGLPWAGAGLFAAGMAVAGFLARRMAFFAQFARFAAVGVLNTAIDFGILNLLSLASGVAGGFVVGGVNLPGFGAAVVNSYFWNKFWVFRDRDLEKIREPMLADFPKFFSVTLVGLFLNSGIVIVLTTYAPFFAALAASRRLNVAKAIATLANLAWNFAGYKFIVFRSSLEK